ncbi:MULTISPECIES: Fe-S cluster assembly sulfur transfer protein SufU [Leuconostoc]|uniref:NifU family protein n=2 Tax=Leuconostoc kimchii TaxID=136609 RepID=D5T3U5_LEUKI|nr:MULTISPECIES: SUF system NifU family Fe-S cluster assembly protein [Leuconostoc]ADG40944.1 NifU family protein [Leuconostoc kimchii IMSNU 11154]AEJ31082.1 NifU family protein [Leuconostoc sp. C2]QBR48172.1 SUF system NifU family Fe-S cluster assembly protein [Leuconostoc kimchii]
MALHNLDNLYRQAIMGYAQNPHHYHPVTVADQYTVRKYNPTCGDVIEIAITTHDQVISDIHFDGDGCAISKASASMMTDLVLNRTLSAAQKMISEFSSMTMGESHDQVLLGEAELLAGVTKFPARIKCATLAWHALDELLTSKN